MSRALGLNDGELARRDRGLYNRVVENEARIRRFTTAFVALLVLAVLWPRPIVWVNDLTFEFQLDLNDRSFLGREAPSWDVVFWFIAGLLAIAMFDRRAEGSRKRLGDALAVIRTLPGRTLARLRLIRPHELILGFAGSVAVVTIVALGGDLRIIALVESFDATGIQPMMLFANRVGGGPIPLLIVAFLALAGILLDRARWVNHAIVMAAAGLVAGLLTQATKFAFPRARPELWIGPFEKAAAGAGSFPSGHAMAAFVIAAVLIRRESSVGIRIVVGGLAMMVAMGRVMAFRHWPSDVIMSIIVGSTLGWLFASAIEEPYDLPSGKESA